MKKRFAIILSVMMLLCTGCGNSKSSDHSKNAYDSYSTVAALDGNGAEHSVMAVQETDYEWSEETDYEATANAADADGGYEDGFGYTEGDTDLAPVKENGNGAIKKEMLVYRGQIYIDTLDFDTSVSDFKKLLSEKNGFVEDEAFSDNCSSGGYYAVDDEKKHNVYTATVRVPSSEYDAMMNQTTTLGDVRSRYSNASNVTQQYGTYQSQLEIYEAEYARYLTLLENATSDEYALKIENELFDIQIQIANLKSGISNIENDVSYSYIDITINEVSEYVEEPIPTDTFWGRLLNTCKKSWNGFLGLLEDLLFFIIMNIFYIIIILVVVVLIVHGCKKKKALKASANPYPNPNGMTTPYGNMNVVPNTASYPLQDANEIHAGETHMNEMYVGETHENEAHTGEENQES